MDATILWEGVMKKREIPQFGNVTVISGRNIAALAGKLTLVEMGGRVFIQIDCPCQDVSCEYMPDFLPMDNVISIESSTQIQAHNKKRDEAIGGTDQLKDLIDKLKKKQ